LKNLARTFYFGFFTGMGNDGLLSFTNGIKERFEFVG
jgi:hypothetical protein